ncbi:MAG TPA: formate dehydrogenase accessory sulfurtransferase FdhD [Phycisphaerae bacterium]|nr:formate dehydrogenase accessory sulfurtransferase FdhD [Phycisphaerae bacterium]
MESIRPDHPTDETDPEKTEHERAARDQTIEWPIRRYHRSGRQTALQDRVVREQRVELLLNGVPLLAMLALPRDVEALALGFLVSEGLWRDCQRLPEVCFDPSAGRVDCTGPFDEDAAESIHRRWTFGTGCGGGGTARDPSVLAECRPLASRVTVPAARLAARGREFSRQGALYRLTGGVHACGIADADRVLLFAEDVGRHNAFDKVAGMALLARMDLSNKIALTTGRLSAEIVGKAVAHGVPLLASSSAPTAMGVQWARRFGMTLVGFLRGGRMNVYTGYQRVTGDSEPGAAEVGGEPPTAGGRSPEAGA